MRSVIITPQPDAEPPVRHSLGTWEEKRQNIFNSFSTPFVFEGEVQPKGSMSSLLYDENHYRSVSEANQNSGSNKAHNHDTFKDGRLSSNWWRNNQSEVRSNRSKIAITVGIITMLVIIGKNDQKYIYQIC